MYRSLDAFVAATTSSNVAIITGGAAIPGKLTSVQKVVIQPHPSNAALAYVGNKDMDTSSGKGVIGVIPKPAAATTGPFTELVLDAPTQLGGMQLASLYINGTTGDKFIVRYI